MNTCDLWGQVHLDKKVKLLDSPGIVFTKNPDPSTALRNCVKLEKLDDPGDPSSPFLVHTS